MSIPESWQKFSRDNIIRSQNERAASERLRSEIENCLRACANELWANFSNVNNMLKARVQETTDARNKLQAKLSQVCKPDDFANYLSNQQVNSYNFQSKFLERHFVLS